MPSTPTHIQGVIEPLVRLCKELPVTEATLLEHVTSTLANLADDDQARPRLVQQVGSVVVCQIRQCRVVVFSAWLFVFPCITRTFVSGHTS